jgi:hypothetical protein
MVRDNFIEVTSSGLMFFNSMGILFFILPYIFYRYFSKDTFVLAFQLPYFF